MCVLQCVVVCIAENQTQGLVHGKQTFYQQIHTPSWDSVFWEKKNGGIKYCWQAPSTPALFNGPGQFITQKYLFTWN